MHKIIGSCGRCNGNARYKLKGLYGEVIKVCFFDMLTLRDRGWTDMTESNSCTCTVIELHNEPGEIEFCPLHEAAKDMLVLLKDLKQLIYFGETDPYRDSVRVQEIVSKVEVK